MPRLLKPTFLFACFTVIFCACSTDPQAVSSGWSGFKESRGQPDALPSPAATITPTPFQPLPTATHTTNPSPTPTLTLTSTFTTTPIPPAETPAPTPLPSSARVGSIYGLPQSYNLDCESRSAVDWAAYYGYQINHQEFLDALPRSDNPETGFVGSYYDYGGQVPPASYGVHAAPVAALLRSYGVPAEDVKGMTWQQLQTEIASNRPVIVWVISGLANGTPLNYNATDGSSTIVAHNEHTVIVIGYNDQWVTVLDGGVVYGSTLQQFLNSWSVLGYMAVISAQ